MQMCGLKWVNDNQIRNALNIARHRTCADRNNEIHIRVLDIVTIAPHANVWIEMGQR